MSIYNPSHAVFMNGQLKHIQVGITRSNRQRHVVRELQLTSFDDSNSAREEAAATTRRREVELRSRKWDLGDQQQHHQ
jgi:hypothetical protein